jgi:hypothetical protein
LDVVVAFGLGIGERLQGLAGAGAHGGQTGYTK